MLAHGPVYSHFPPHEQMLEAPDELLLLLLLLVVVVVVVAVRGVRARWAHSTGCAWNDENSLQLCLQHLNATSRDAVRRRAVGETNENEDGE